ncbi:uncharacterized protein Dvir_GJ25636 [Drosophila virilis]|uniref:Uncharacterized protein n=1 Tax=Drosophila virilis TaxID=7244 RepID=A0A0Q9WHX9_DROVI|nr:uncharacterized protein Dvir_GJ25636 [Drosophila virilis]
MYFGWQHCTTNQLSRAFVLLMCLSINNVAMIVSLRKCSTCLLGSGLGLDIYHQVVLAIIPSSRCTTSRASRATCVSPCAYVVIFGLTHPGIRRLRSAYVSVGLHVLSPFANGLHIIALFSCRSCGPRQRTAGATVETPIPTLDDLHEFTTPGKHFMATFADDVTIFYSAH